MVIQESDTTYQSNLRSAVRALWLGMWGTGQFLDTMLLNFRKELPKAWSEGAANCGIKPADYSDEEKAALEQIISDELGYAADFADYIVAHSKKEGYALQPLFDRITMWVTRRLDVVNQAKLMSCADARGVWRLGPTEQHCPDCFGYNGKVYRMSTWAKYARPQARELSCKGYRCLCKIEITDLPLTKGKPKRMTYA